MRAAKLVAMVLGVLGCGPCEREARNDAPPPAPTPPPAASQTPIVVAAAEFTHAPPSFQSEEDLAWPFPVDTVEYGPNGRAVAAGGGSGLFVVDLAGLVPRLVERDVWVATAHWSADGAAIAVSDRYHGDSGFHLVDGASGAISDLDGPYGEEGPWHVVFNRGRTAFAWSKRNQVSSWTASSGKQVASETHRDQVAMLAVADRHAASADGQELWLWSISPLTRRAVFPWAATAVSALAFSPDGSLLAAAAENGEVVLVDVERSTVRATLTHPTRVSDLRFSADARRLATACGDGVARIWSTGGLDAPAVLHALAHPAPVQGVDFSPDGTTLATGADDGRVRLFDAGAGDLKGSVRLQPPPQPSTVPLP